MRDILADLAGTIPDDVAAVQLQFAWKATDVAYGFAGNSLPKGPNDPNYISKRDNPLKAPSLAPNEKFWVAPPTGKYYRKKPDNAKKGASLRKRFTRPKVTPGPKAWRIARCQKDIPEKLKGQVSTRPIVLDGPGYDIVEVATPSPEAIELIRQGRIRGAYIDRAGVIRTVYEASEDEELPIPLVYPGRSKRDAIYHFEQGN